MDEDQTYKIFGLRLGSVRRAKDMTQTDLAHLIGMSRASIANIEAGRQKIMLHQLLKITNALKLRSPNELIPMDLVFGVEKTNPEDVIVTGDIEISKKQRVKLARILDAFEDIGI